MFFSDLEAQMKKVGLEEGRKAAKEVLSKLKNPFMLAFLQKTKEGEEEATRVLKEIGKKAKDDENRGE